MRSPLTTTCRLSLVFLLMSVCTGALSAKDNLPLKPDRAVKYETDEVTWLSLDTSPDGEMLVIEAVGHLYTLQAGGGEATQITHGMSFNSQPAWSPNGECIAFLSDRRGKEELWIMEPDGSKSRRISSGSEKTELASPTWAPDSSHIVVSETTWPQRTYALKAYHLDGGSGVAITRSYGSSDTGYSDRWNALGAQYSPDGEFLYYAGKYGGFGYDLRFPLWQIYRRELKSGDQDVLTSAIGSAFKPAISPDGHLLVYGTRDGSRTRLRIRNLHTGVDSVLVSEVTRDEQESRFTRDLLPGYTFTPDGSKVIFTANGKIRTVDINTREMSEIAFNLVVDRKIGPRLYFPYRIGIGPVSVRLARDAAMSPKGQHAVFTALGKLHKVHLDTGDVQPLGQSEDYIAQPTWSPDGRHLAYVTWSFDGGHVYTMRANGRGKPKRVTTIPALYSEPLWFSDNKQIIAVRANSQDRLYQGSDWGQLPATDLVSIPVGGGDIRVIRPSRGLRTPHLGPDSNRIYLYRSPGVFGTGDSGIISIRLDGSDWEQHLIAKGNGIYFAQEPVPARSAMLSPDGSHALALSANHLYLFRMFKSQLLSIDTNVHNASIPVIKLTDVGADEFGFSSDGKAVHWTVGSTLYTRPIDSIAFREEEEENAEEENETKEDAEPDSDSNGDDSDKETADGTKNEGESDEGSEDDEDLVEDEPDTDVADAEEKTQKEKKDELKEEHESVVSYELTVYRPRYSPTGTLVLTGATVIPMSSDEEELIENATIVVQDDRMHFVGSDYTPADDAMVMDMSGLYIVPGYIDTHAHYRIHREVLGSQAASLMAHLAYGVTTGLDVQPSTVDLLDYQDLVDAGTMIGSRPLSTGPGIFSDNSFNSRSHARAVLDRYKKHYRVHNLKAYISGGRKQRQWMVQAAKELELMPTTEGGLDFKVGITHVIDGFSGHEHNFPSTDLRRDVVELVARSGIAYTPTLLVNYGGPSGGSWYFTNESPYEDAKLARFTSPILLQSRALRGNWFHPSQYVFSELAEQALKIVRANGKVGIGAHGELQGLGYHWELWALHSGGFSNFQALRAATRHGAEMIGIGEDVGTLEAGKLADLVVLTANPLEDIRATAAIRFVMQGGVLRDGETLDEIWPETRSAPELKWGVDP